jgi:hypothetical protein
MATLEKGTRVSFVGDPKDGSKAMGTVMQASHQAGGVQMYEIHTDRGSVIHLPEVDNQGNRVLTVKGKTKDDDKD